MKYEDNYKDIDGVRYVSLSHAKEAIDSLESDVSLLKDECKRFYGLMDNISTFGDMYKPKIDGYVNALSSEVEKGLNDGLIYTDGYSLLFKKSI